MRFVFLYALSKAIFLSDISGETCANMHNDLREKSQLNLSEYQIWWQCARRISSCFMRTDRSLERTQAPRVVPNALKTWQRSNYGQRVTSADSRCGITTLSRIWGTATAHKWVITTSDIWQNSDLDSWTVRAHNAEFLRNPRGTSRPGQLAISPSFYVTELYSK